MHSLRAKYGILLERLIINDESISYVGIDYGLVSLIYFLNRNTMSYVIADTSVFFSCLSYEDIP
jgi:hypothetical protein